jgi:hypothetical protein
VKAERGWRAARADPESTHLLLRDPGEPGRLAARADAEALGIDEVPIDVLDRRVRSVPAAEDALMRTRWQAVA